MEWDGEWSQKAICLGFCECSEIMQRMVFARPRNAMTNMSQAAVSQAAVL